MNQHVGDRMGAELLVGDERAGEVKLVGVAGRGGAHSS